MVAKIAKILVYPIKSLDGVLCDYGTIVTPGTLNFDRRWAIFDDQGEYVNGKRNSRVHQLCTEFDLSQLIVTFRHNQGSVSFNLVTETDPMNQWLSEYFQQPVFLQEEAAGGFPDDLEAYGPTVISTATLETVASWFPSLTVENARSRFRANLEISGVPPFWEDQLFAETRETVKFEVGSVQLEGVNPCQRCIVPTRDPHSGETYPQFQRIFIQQRQATLPSWTVPTRFNHYYRLSVNTRIPPSQVGKIISVGDKVTI
ncbi:MOSC domain containing protein [Halothece sp. PCC 7418]|uniref:MOSC domain-containing protein n=1 Tax=Halothece sp. (strain PCC 7418) TaxID=65093 RepID=UPI0002A08AD2|nr:MOSC N-terminal beta barrel domain-containing protein [Halothece sp. PCC 7418]AFZ42978.1 MOSC domain containing protein [Halothece sp. PCC 7418]